MTSSDHARLFQVSDQARAIIAEQLEVHLPLAPATVLAVGPDSGLVTSLRSQGFEVSTSPDALTLDDALPSDQLFDVVLAHDVLRDLPDPNPAIRALGRRLADDAILSVVALNASALAWRAVLEGRTEDADAQLGEQERARWERRDATLAAPGGRVRADTIERLGAFFGGSRVGVEGWYGVGVAPMPPDPARKDLDLELRLGRTEPYKRLGELLHVVGRRGVGRGPQIRYPR